jgi:hypothetical protein
LPLVLSPNDSQDVRVGFSDLSKVIHINVIRRTSKGQNKNCCRPTECAIQYRSRTERLGWAIFEEDEGEKQLGETPNGKPEDECAPGHFEHTDGHPDTENDSFLPKSPPQSKPSQKETRHWIPSRSRHVIISPEMLNDQLDLNSPYDPNPFNDPNLEKVLTIPNQKPDVNGARHRVQKRRTRWTKIQATILNRGYVPLVLRLISWIFSIAALFLAGFITRESVVGGVETRPSTVMAFVANGIAIFYLPLIAKVYKCFTVLNVGRIFRKSNWDSFSESEITTCIA